MSVHVESPYGDTPDEDVACADCGLYSELIGPLSFDGEVLENGDFVCRSCAKARGFVKLVDKRKEAER